MKILLDTHVIIWYFQDSKKLSLNISRLLENSDNQLKVSIVSLWEIAIKLSLGKLDLGVSFHDFQGLLKNLSIKVLPISLTDTEEYLNLPLHHRDPFDRMLIAQAIANSLTIVSADAALDAYPVQRLWA
ncbi:MAG: type II toxin-antitoxin system VapC family toxin [Spirulinaceae cyanobacterium]